MRGRRLRRAACGLQAALLLLAAQPAMAATSGAEARGGSAVPPPGENRAHVLFDDGSGPPRPGIAPGAPAGTLTQPKQPVAGTAAPRVASPGPPVSEILGFAQTGEVTGGAWQHDLRLNLLSTVAYTGVTIAADGTIVSDAGLQGWQSAQATQLINSAHGYGDRVVLTIKQFDTGTIAAITGSDQAQQNCIAAVINQLATRGGDGVNVDFEGYSGSIAPGFTRFIARLRSALLTQVPARAFLTVDTFGSSPQGGTMFDIPGLSPYVDAFDVMAYDLTSLSSANAGPVAPLTGYSDTPYTVTGIVNSYLGVVPASQIILGVPYYGFKWSTTSTAARAPTISGTGRSVVYSQLVSDFGCAEQLTQNWDGTFYGPWATWYSPSFGDPCQGYWGSWRELYYDNAASLGGKYDLVNGRGLRGIGIWALGYDSGHGELWDEIAAKFPVRPAAAVLPAVSNGAYGGYVTAATIQNAGSAAARVSISYVDQNGFPVGIGDAIDSLPPNASWTVRQDNHHSFGAGGAGSAIVYSDQPIASFVNEFAPGNAGDATSYTGIPVPSGVGTTLYAPNIVNKAYGGYTTGIGLLNQGATATAVTITYRDGYGTVVKTQTVASLPANAYQALYSGDTTLALPDGFAGTATITGAPGALLGAVVNETGPGGQFSSYDAVPAGATSLNAPVALNNAFGGYYTGMGIQNTSAVAGSVSIAYYDATGKAAGNPMPVPILANGYLGVYQGSTTDGPPAGAYTAVIQSTVPLAAIVNEVAPVGAGSARQSTSYNALPAGNGTLHLPLVENGGSDPWNTGEGIMNTGMANTTVTVTYYNAATGAAVGTPQTSMLAPHGVLDLYQPDLTSGLPAGSRATAVVTATPGQVAVITNESSAAVFMSYNGS